MMQTHLILTLGRSGSNTLVDMLNQNPTVLNYGEVLGEWNKLRKLQRRLRLFQKNDQIYLDSILEKFWILRLANFQRNFVKLAQGRGGEIKNIQEIKSVGFKEFSLNLERYSLADYVRSRSHIKIVALTRSNVIERMISNEFLKYTGIVSSLSKGAKSRQKKLSIPSERVICKLELIEKEAQRLEAMISEVEESRVFRVDYADLYNDSDFTIAMVRQIYDFLGADDFVPKVRMTKLVKSDPLASLENGDEVRAVIERSRFSNFLY